ncbi:MAG: SDR family NAD(P)-dependent oxidoreductase [Oscillospiraceae bacterium]|jgi:NAD(P)-dependent dehydrogenase (short-subunit alcohol dehydrogenase family)/rhamnose utilization protein RhaD (predicted bifunctional aldolase and dehydrogenase)|nr:SDR family NAD(P)-dependent oxidoreductase [Oscillospiraceae bacterium]
MLDQLVEVSNRYGADPRYVLAGGGNTSYKTEDTLYVKASGTKLATIAADGFAKMDLAALRGILRVKAYPDGDKEREAAALADMMSALLRGETKRPSVECLLHALFPQKFVLHLHPALVNGMTCGRDGERICRELFPDAIWIPLTKPGYILAKACQGLFASYEKKNGKPADMLFMQNHGVIVAADTAEGLDALMANVMGKLGERVACAAISTDRGKQPSPEMALTVLPQLRMLYANECGSAVGVLGIDEYIYASRPDYAPLAKPYTPDQIVYCKAEPLIISVEDDVAGKFADYVKAHGFAPKIVLLPCGCAVALGKTKREADTALEVLKDSAKIAWYANAFGGFLQLPDEFTDFILDWEVENYRQKVSIAGGSAKRMAGKVCVVTGAAQGFGEGIARAICREGGYCVIADMNLAGAEAAAKSIRAEYGEGAAVACQSDVSNEESVKAMIDAAVANYGGLDVMVSCAGIAIAGSLEAMTLDRFNKVAAVNYAGYYLCAKYSSAVMKLQRSAAQSRMFDIIEINSKSGLEGSKANFAYSGSKFGGIGLTQSFALELAEYGIKVNAICPGNLLDGPLWSDPERGLFKQYLDAGKVPGAASVADVRRFYEEKVPLGRGCEVEDVARALFYIVEQKYETGQAVPVTGGQVMLS